MLEEHRERLKSSQGSVELWAIIRGLLHLHRGFPDADWALPSEELDRLTSVYEYLQPGDPILANAWLFGHWSELPEARVGVPGTKARIEEVRASALASLIEQYRDDVVVALARSSAAPWTAGRTFVAVCPDEDRIASVVMSHVSDSNHALRNFALSALGHLRAKLGWPALERIIERVRVADPAPQHIANIYLAHRRHVTRGSGSSARRVKCRLHIGSHWMEYSD